MLLKAEEWTDITPDSFHHEFECPRCRSTIIMNDPSDIKVKKFEVSTTCKVCKTTLHWGTGFQLDTAKKLVEMYHKVRYVQEQHRSRPLIRTIHGKVAMCFSALIVGWYLDNYTNIREVLFTLTGG